MEKFSNSGTVYDHMNEEHGGLFEEVDFDRFDLEDNERDEDEDIDVEEREDDDEEGDGQWPDEWRNCPELWDREVEE
jgi:hypothetical protein